MAPRCQQRPDREATLTWILGAARWGQTLPSLDLGPSSVTQEPCSAGTRDQVPQQGTWQVLSKSKPWGCTGHLLHQCRRDLRPCPKIGMLAGR